MGFCRLTEIQLDALREVSNIGMGHAATALSQLVGRTVHMNVPRVAIREISAVPEFLGGAERMVVGIYLQILGDARGNILLVFPRESAVRLLEKLLTRKGSKGPILTELEMSTLKEVGNILASSFLNALGQMLQRTIIPSVPMLSFDMAGAVVDYILMELGMTGDLALMVETEFAGDDELISGQFFLLPDPATIGTILKTIGVDGE